MYETEIALINKKNFQQLSYSKWAANEVLSYVLKRQNVRPLFAVEEFSAIMDKHACENSKTGYIFSVAYDISTDILDMLIAKGEQEK